MFQIIFIFSTLAGELLGRAFIVSVCSEEAMSCSIQLLLFKCVLCACVHICCQNMGDKLRKEHEELKAELKKLIKEHKVLQTKMADKLDRNFAPSHEDVQYLL